MRLAGCPDSNCCVLIRSVLMLTAHCFGRLSTQEINLLYCFVLTRTDSLCGMWRCSLEPKIKYENLNFPCKKCFDLLNTGVVVVVFQFHDSDIELSILQDTQEWVFVTSVRILLWQSQCAHWERVSEGFYVTTSVRDTILAFGYCTVLSYCMRVNFQTW